MIFVFGSNMAGRHGKGAALEALREHGAEYGNPEGRQGNSYAIPTKTKNFRRRDLGDILLSVNTFIDYARGVDEIFYLTPIGCGLAGINAGTIYDHLKSVNLPNNVVLSHHWVNDHDLTEYYDDSGSCACY